MKEFTFEVNWALAGTMTIEANTLEEALKKAYCDEPLPEDTDYLSDSFRVTSLMGEEIFHDSEPDVLDEFYKELVENTMVREVKTA